MIYIYCDYREAGGVERVSVNLASKLDKLVPTRLLNSDGHRVYLAVAYPVREQQPTKGDVIVFSRKSDLIKILPCWRPGVRLIYWRHLPVSRPDVGFMSRLLDSAFIICFSYLFRTICVCPELSRLLQAIPLVRKSHIDWCYSPYDVTGDTMVDIRPAPHILNASGEHPFRFIYFGRPSPQKRFELIEDIAAFFEEHEVHAEIHVFGYSNLEPAAGIVNRGLTNDPISEMRSADCLLMASAYEGFPTVLVEAAITGTPVLTMNFETGLTDFIKDFGPVAVAQTDAELLRAAREIVREGSRLLPRGQYNLGHVKSEISLKRWVTCLLD